MSEPRNTAFEELKRTNPNLKSLATVWRGSDEYAAWMQLYIDQETDIIQYVENEQVTTFYKLMDEAEIQRKEDEKVAAEPDGPAQYEILGQVHECGNETQGKHTAVHVKLGTPRWQRAGNRYALVKYVLIDRVVHYVDDEIGKFTFTETRVLVSDEEAKDYTDDGVEPIYVTPGWLTDEEALWPLGEIATYTEGNN